jgi:hypothetical protein
MHTKPRGPLEKNTALLTNIRLGWNHITMENGLAYCREKFIGHNFGFWLSLIKNQGGTKEVQ